MKISFHSNKNGRSSSSQNYNRLRELEDMEHKEVEDRLEKYLSKMAKAEEIKHSYMSEKLNHTHQHLEKVEKNLQRRHEDESNDFIGNSPHFRSLTQKYERTKKIKQEAMMRQEMIKRK